MPRHAGTHRGSRLSNLGQSISWSEKDEMQHLMECVDPHCCWCNDEPPAQRDPEVQAWLDAIEAQHSSQLAA